MSARPLRRLDGILLLDKPEGQTANRALLEVKRLLGAAKAGHAGTLDPLATGVLPICLGEATKVSRFLLGADKVYRFTARLGVTTDTGDAQGAITAQQPVPPLQPEQVRQVLDQFVGPQIQIPPMHSAVKVNGTRLYKLARRGAEVARPGREIVVHELKLLEQRPAELLIDLVCSKGTYVRTLAQEIGAALGCGAHVSQLRRLRAGALDVRDAYTMEQVRAMSTDGAAVEAALLPIDCAIGAIPRVPVARGKADLMRRGQAVAVAPPGLAGWIALYCNDRFIGVGEALGDGTIAPRRLLRTG